MFEYRYNASHLSSTERDDEIHTQTAFQSRISRPKIASAPEAKGAQTIEGLSDLTGTGWEQVFFPVDRLSRTGKVSLTLVRPCEYRVSVAQPAR